MMASRRILGQFHTRTPREAAMGMVVVASTSGRGGRAVHLEGELGKRDAGENRAPESDHGERWPLPC
jgi:hypothetical protein